MGAGRTEYSGLSDLLRAATGVNRPETGKRTAPSAMNTQGIDLYVFMKDGVYLYDCKNHQLELIVDGDHCNMIACRQEDVAKAPVICLTCFLYMPIIISMIQL
jgi:hypothetical protein